MVQEIMLRQVERQAGSFSAGTTVELGNADFISVSGQLSLDHYRTEDGERRFPSEKPNLQQSASRFRTSVSRLFISMQDEGEAEAEAEAEAEGGSEPAAPSEPAEPPSNSGSDNTGSNNSGASGNNIGSNNDVDMHVDIIHVSGCSLIP